MTELVDPVVDPVVSQVVGQVVGEAVDLLVRLRRDRVPPDAAWDEVVGLRARHPGRFLNMVWERESYSDQVHYDVLVEAGAGTLSISYCGDDDVPWPVRGLQRVNESIVLRVNDDPVQIDQVITSLDYAWHKLHLAQHLVNMSLIDQEIRARQIEASDEQLEAALTAFRVRRGLFTAAAVEQWMAAHGITQVKLEHHLRLDATRGMLRAQVIGAGEPPEAYFAAHRDALDRVHVAKLAVATRDEADALHRGLRDEPHRLLAVAQQRFLQGAASGELFATLRRDELDADQAGPVFATEPGQLAPVLASGDGFAVIQVLRRVPAVLDDATRAAIADRLFDRWLAGARERARIEWFWGAAEAAEVPALAL